MKLESITENKVEPQYRLNAATEVIKTLVIDTEKMKKINKLLLLFILGLLISCQTDWKTDYEKLIEKSQKDFSIVKQADTLENSINRMNYSHY